MTPLCLLARTIRAFGRGWDRATAFLSAFGGAILLVVFLETLFTCVMWESFGWWGVLGVPLILLAIALLCYAIHLISRLRRWADHKAAQCDATRD